MRKRKKYDPAKSAAIKRTAEVFEVEQDYVRKVDNGVRENDEIKRYYRALYKSLREALKAEPA